MNWWNGISGRRVVVLVGIALVVLAMSGCGQRQSAQVTTTTTTTRPSTTRAEVRPGPPAIRLRREHDQLITAYAPVSEYVNVYMSSRIMYANHHMPASEYRAVIKQYLRRLTNAHQRVSGAMLRESSPVRRQLLAAITSRIDAMRALRKSLDVGGTQAPSEVAASTVARLEARSEAAWSASLGVVREATNIAQQERKDVALEPMREDAFR